MKKIFAISLLIIHLFNVAGYQFLFKYFIDRSDINASQQFDQNLYNDKDLAEVKIPLNLPYMNDMPAFERIDGNVEFNGVHYNYVKRKISRDTLYILCQPNYIKTKLVNEKTGYAGDVNNSPLNKKLPASSLKKGICQDEYNQLNQEFYAANTFTIISISAIIKSSKLPTIFYHVTGEPPEQNC